MDVSVQTHTTYLEAIGADTERVDHAGRSIVKRAHQSGKCEAAPEREHFVGVEVWLVLERKP